MNIDIEKEREWWDGASESTERAHSYLDELEATRKESRLFEDALSLARNVENELRAQLTDQRARDIRIMADQLWEGEDPTSAIHAAAYNYDRLAAIPVPPSEVERG